MSFVMKDELISFETAKLAKEKRFNIFNDSYTKRGTIITSQQQARYIEECIYPAPTQSLLQRWLREKHGLHVEPKLANQESKKSYYYGVYKWDKYRAYIKGTNVRFDTYEQALEGGLLEAVKLIV
tara:strand:+ start:1201 stop:1575 length:375 start_codon:yes stop_codon:yes gene_type:complete